MKLRTDFVTNSSSSSFIVVKMSDFKNYKNKFIRESKKYVIGESGELSFGWGIEKHTDFDTKVNWLALIAHYNDLSTEFLEAAIKELTGCSSIITDAFYKAIDDGDAYIDHQSSDDPESIFVLKNYDILIKFLGNDESYVWVDNDNH